MNVNEPKFEIEKKEAVPLPPSSIPKRPAWKLHVEEWTPAVVMGLTFVAGWICERLHLLPTVTDRAQQLFASTVDVGAIAAGFLATSQTMLLSFKGTAADRFITNSGLSALLGRYLRRAAWAALFFACTSLICVGALGMPPPPNGVTTLPWYLLVFWASLTMYGAAAVVRAMRIFFKVFDNKAKVAD